MRQTSEIIEASGAFEKSSKRVLIFSSTNSITDRSFNDDKSMRIGDYPVDYPLC